jgi:hypothetical protein
MLRSTDLQGARAVLNKIAKATWECGDPGMQYDTTINRWHTSKNSARINASNPCSEYMFLDDSACNLASPEPDEVCADRHISTWSHTSAPWRSDHGAGHPDRSLGYPTDAIGATRTTTVRWDWVTPTWARC